MSDSLEAERLVHFDAELGERGDQLRVRADARAARGAVVADLPIDA